MQRVGFVLLSVGGLFSCEPAEEEPLCAPADEILVFEDVDQDGFGARIIGYRCGLTLGQSSNNVDCSDDDPLVFPGALEICDNVDNDCDGGIDEGFNPLDFYLDSDGDGYGDPESLVRACDQPGPTYVFDNTDCNDEFDTVSPGAIEVCDNDLDDDCNGVIDDRFESACGDYKDNDCDGLIDCFDPDCDNTPTCRLDCTDIVVPTGGLPQTIVGSTTDPLPSGALPVDDQTPNFFCIGGRPSSSPEVVLQWRAPETRYYSFSTAGSSFDTALTIFIGECDASPDQCNDNDGPNITSLIPAIFLQEGDLAAIVVDGVGTGVGQGDFQVTIEGL